MNAYKIGLKYYLRSGEDTDPETWFRILNTWIPVSVDEILIDVADYSHVHNGPVTLLVGHEANYGIDRGDGRIGLLYSRKQPLEGNLEERFQACFAVALGACNRLETEPDLKDSVQFDGAEFQVILNDRLNAPNDAKTLGAVEPALRSVLGDLYGGAEAAFDHIDDPRRLFALNVKMSGDWEVSNLLKNLSVST